MSVISSENVNAIIRKTLSLVNPKIIDHGEITGYILYKMLEYENIYSEQELVDYTMLGILHDIGIYKEENVENVVDFETKNLWSHSIYGFLFLKYLSPMGDKAEIVLYHHLDYNRYPLINSKYMHIIECLNLADKMDAFMHMKNAEMPADYFNRYRDIAFSGQAQDLFCKAEKSFHIMEKLGDGSYQQELDRLLSKQVFSEKYKRGFLEMLVYTIDFRSEHTVVHTMSTVNFAGQLGRLMRISGIELRNLYYGALLHDLGKLCIPLHILESSGKLSEEEMKVMKAHVRITEMILEGIVDDDVLQIAVRHHEKLDGSGYHKGLTEADLTLPQQIVAVADILSALYGKRSYKEAFDSEKIKAILNGDAENHKISQKVVDCLMMNYDSVIANYEKEKEATVGLYLKIKEQYAQMAKIFEKFN
ncbi:MAG: HD domain-containing protein [Lachnospiraceae bacterium]|nr:HD domain-containing protein [Lachnospiraceae bacterium]